MHHDVLVVGNYCHDLLDQGEQAQAFRGLGGSASYISRVLGALGVDFGVVAKVGEDFGYAAEVSRAPLVVPGALTTRFRMAYAGCERRETLEAVCEPIFARDLNGTARLGLACGVAMEIRPETISELARRCETVLCDVQGLIRQQGPGGLVTLGRLEETPFYECLPQIGFLKASRQEAEWLDLAQVRKRTRLIVTDGANGATLYDASSKLHVPAFKAEERDPTGAGDCFLAGFAFGLLRGLDREQALRVGNYCGALAVAQVGVPRLSVHDFDFLFEDSTSKTTIT